MKYFLSLLIYIIGFVIVWEAIPIARIPTRMARIAALAIKRLEVLTLFSIPFMEVRKTTFSPLSSFYWRGWQEFVTPPILYISKTSNNGIVFANAAFVFVNAVIVLTNADAVLTFAPCSPCFRTALTTFPHGATGRRAAPTL